MKQVQGVVSEEIGNASDLCDGAVVCICCRSDLDRLRTAVIDAKSKKSTQRNESLLPAEDELSKLSYDLNLAVAEVSQIFTRSYVLLHKWSAIGIILSSVCPSVCLFDYNTVHYGTQHRFAWLKIVPSCS